jgi:DNA-binding MarR family transcriptional regulator
MIELSTSTVAHVASTFNIWGKLRVMSEVRWLSTEEQRVWRSFLAATGIFMERVDRQLQQDSGMPRTYYEILVALSDVPGQTMRMSDLAFALRSSRSRLSHAISRLEAEGWIERSACADDKRGSWATLTESGFETLKAAAPGHVTVVRHTVFDALSAEQVAQLGEICDTIIAGMSGECAMAKAELEVQCDVE